MKKLIPVLVLLVLFLSCNKQDNSGQRGYSSKTDTQQYAQIIKDDSNVKKYALVIGNGNYTGISKLKNPVNDANDISAALQRLGFIVDKVTDAGLEKMENAIQTFKNRLSVTQESYGFLFYAGHGVQAAGENYLIPVDANIQSEASLRLRTVSVQSMLDELNKAGNILNIVVLDACRDNPFGWARSGSRGLTTLANPPADSIIVYATSAGSVAGDGDGKNGLFTSHFLPNLETPGLEVNEVFRRTMGDVAQGSGNQQRPAVYNQFPGLAYLGSRPVENMQTTTPVSQPVPAAVVTAEQQAAAHSSVPAIEQKETIHSGAVSDNVVNAEVRTITTESPVVKEPEEKTNNLEGQLLK